MFLTDYIRVYENAVPANICDEIIGRFDQSPNVHEDHETTEDGQIVVRNNLELNLSKDESFKDIQAVMMKIAELAIGKYQSEIPCRTFPKELGAELYRVKKYRVGDTNDHFSYHVDVNSHASARRFLALIWYLNDVDQGGDTFFPHPNVRVKPKKGRLLMFPSLWMYPHVGEVPISNDKYIIVTYLHYL